MIYMILLQEPNLDYISFLQFFILVILGKHHGLSETPFHEVVSYFAVKWSKFSFIAIWPNSKVPYIIYKVYSRPGLIPYGLHLTSLQFIKNEICFHKYFIMPLSPSKTFRL